MTQPQEFLRGGADTYEEKNEDYGDSWRKVGYVMWMMAGKEPITLESPEDFIRIGLYTRRLDKLFRTFNGDFVADGDLNFEAVQDNHLDDMVYAAMQASTYTDDKEVAQDPDAR